MVYLVGALVTALSLSTFIFPILIKYSQRKNFLDLPGHRRIHKRVTPSIGGVSIFIGFLVSAIIWQDIFAWPGLKVLLGVLLIIFVLGLCDDLVHVKPVVKIVGQVIAGSIAFFLLSTRISSTYGFFYQIAFNDWIAYALTIFAIIILTNAYNLIDGIDGLAGTVAAIALTAFGVWFWFVGESHYAILSFALLGAVIAFLIFNWEPSKIFMGDTGALVIGIFLSLMGITFLNLNTTLPTDSLFKFQAPLSTLTCILIIPIYDTARIIVVRLSRGISPLTPDKRHIHHMLVRIGFSHQRSVLILITVQLLFATIAIVMRPYPDVYVFPVVIVLSVALNLLLDNTVRRRLPSYL